MSLDLSALSDEVLSIANTMLAELFHIRMVTAIGPVYYNDIIGYCDTYNEKYEELKNTNRALNKSVVENVKKIKETILSKGKGNFDARYHLDITALNHLIIYSKFRAIIQTPFVSEVDTKRLMADIFERSSVITDFSEKVKDLTNSRNCLEHTPSTKDELRPNREAEHELINILQYIVKVESFLNYLRSTGWRDVGVLEYYVRMEGKISSIKDKIFSQSEDLIKTVFCCKNKILKERIKIYLRRVEGSNPKSIAAWYISNDGFEIHLPQGRYYLELEKSAECFEILPSASISILRDGEDAIFNYQVEKVMTNEEKLISAFDSILCEKEIDRNLKVLQELDGKQYYPAIQLLAFMYRYGLGVNMDRALADEYQLVMTSLVRTDELWKSAETAKEKKNLLLAAILYIGYSMNSDLGVGYYRAGSCLTKARKGYSFCLQCMKLAMEKNYVDENAPTSITVERIVKQLESPKGREMFS